jgi:hypothetical protein
VWYNRNKQSFIQGWRGSHNEKKVTTHWSEKVVGHSPYHPSIHSCSNYSVQPCCHVLSYFSIDNAVLKSVPSVYALHDRWDLEDTPETEEKNLKVAKRRYRGWRSTLSSIYKAYTKLVLLDWLMCQKIYNQKSRNRWHWFKISSYL